MKEDKYELGYQDALCDIFDIIEKCAGAEKDADETLQQIHLLLEKEGIL